MVKTSEEVGKVSHLIKEDISQMGVKAWGQVNSSNSNSSSSYTPYYVHNVGKDNPKIYWSASSSLGDSSSYALYHRDGPTAGTFCDKIVFRKAVFDTIGRFIGIREIEWEAIKSANSCKLVRRCATLEGQSNCPAGATCAPAGADIDASVCPTKANASAADSVVIAENVKNFNIIPSKPGMAGNTQDTLFKGPFKFSSVGTVTASISDGNDTSVTISDFAQNSPSATGGGYNGLCLAEASGCRSFTFIKDETYVIEFKMPFASTSGDETEQQKIFNSTQFVPGRDHLAIGFRTVTGGPISNAPKDILFFPAQSDEAANLKRSLEFSMKDTIWNASIVMTIAYYPPEGSSGQVNGAEAMLKFKDFKIFRKADETFHFPKPGDSDYNEKYGTQEESDDKRIWQKTNAKAFELILEIENKGEKSGTYSIDKAGNKKGMVIPTPNNGVTPIN